MHLRTKYFIWIVLLHGLLAVSCYYAIQSIEYKWLVLVLELIVLLSLGLSIWFFYKFKLPRQFIKFNKQALLEEDFNLQYIESDNEELNELYRVFNAMLERIMRERKHSEERQYFLKDVIEVSPAGIILLDYDDKIEMINPKAEAMLHIGGADIGKSIEQSQSIIKSINLLAKDPVIVNVTPTQKLRYTVSSFYFRGFSRKMIMINDLALEILTTEKQSYSKVIRMMAHEINNSIGPINSILNTIKSENPTDIMLTQTLDAAIHRTEALNIFMQNFASVVRLPDPTLEIVDIVPCIEDAVRILQLRFDEANITISKNMLTELTLKIDIFQMEQVLINLLQNSIDAIEQNGEVKIELTANHLRISDNGMGIKSEDREELFTPFFTTKPTGQGIGLTIAKHVLSSHKFEFALFSSGDWTTFEIIF